MACSPNSHYFREVLSHSLFGSPCVCGLGGRFVGTAHIIKQVCLAAHTPDEIASKTLVKSAPDTQQAIRAMGARQTSWLTRSKNGKTTWRPEKVYRLAARSWLFVMLIISSDFS